MSNYNRITFKERVRIEAGIYAKESFSSIAKELGRSTSSITREVQQNRMRIKGSYPCGKSRIILTINIENKLSDFFLSRAIMRLFGHSNSNIVSKHKCKING